MNVVRLLAVALLSQRNFIDDDVLLLSRIASSTTITRPFECLVLFGQASIAAAACTSCVPTYKGVCVRNRGSRLSLFLPLLLAAQLPLLTTYYIGRSSTVVV